MGTKYDKDTAKDWLWPIVFVTTVASIIAAAIDSITKLLDLAENHFYPFVVISVLAAVILVVKAPLGKLSKRFSEPIFRTIVCIIIIAIGASAIGYRIYDKYLPDQGPVNPGEPIIGMLLSIPFGNALAANSTSFKIVHLGIDGRMSNYTERNEALFGSGEAIRTFAADLDVLETRKASQCTGLNGNHPAVAMVQLLRERLNNTGQSNLLKYIETESDLWRLINQQGERFYKIMFSPMEVETLLKNGDSKLNTIMEFVTTCVGQLYPVIRVSLRNSAQAPVYITSVTYDVLAIGDVRGGIGGLEYPDSLFTHILRWEVGEQKIVLDSPVVIQPSKDFTFGLKLIPQIPDGVDPYGRAWHLRVGLEDSEGQQIYSEPFQLIMSKEGL